MTDFTLPDTGDMFDGSMLDELVEQSVAVKKSLNELVNKCWYTDELVVVHMQTPENLELYQDYFLDNIGESFEVVTLDSHVFLTTEEILRRVVHALYPEERTEGGADELLEKLFRHVDQLAEETAELLIQVNDAHQLSLDVLRDLAEILEGHANTVAPHIVLWADQDSEEAFVDRFANSGIIVGTISVPRFSPRELVDYLKIVFRAHDTPFPFDKDALQHLIRQSHGIGAELEQVANGLLRPDAQEQEEISNAGLPLFPILAGVAAVGVLGVVFFMLQKPGGGDETTVVLSIGDTESRTIETEPVVVTRPEAGIAPAVSVEFAVEDEAVSPEPAEPDLAEVPEITGTGTAVSAMPGPDIVVADMDAGDRPDAVPAETLELPVIVEPVEVQQAVALPPNNRRVGVSPGSAYDEQLAALLAHSDSSAFIQLLGTYDENNAREFIADYAIDNSFYYFRTDLNGRDWYVVVYGSFVSERAAIEVKDALSPKLREGSPWIRGMGNIRNSVKR